MRSHRCSSQLRLVNGSTGDPLLYVDAPGRDNALLFDAGETGPLTPQELGDLEAVFITHHHVDHFIGLDRIVRANLDRDKSLKLFGPPQTIRKVYDRIKSYEYQFFPFQKIVLEVSEVWPDHQQVAQLECTRKFPEPVVIKVPRRGSLIYEQQEVSVEAESVDHTVPCLAFALIEKSGWYADPQRLREGGIQPGAWVGEVRKALERGDRDATSLTVHGGQFRLGDLRERFFVKTGGGRVAYITDTHWNETTRPKLVRLAKGAWRLYCDAYYSVNQAKSAATHRHMTTHAAAELASEAKVEQLVLMHLAPRYVGQYEKLLDEARQIFPRVTADLAIL